LLLATLSLAAHVDDGAVTPYRPSIPSQAQLLRADHLEFEFGALGTRLGETWRDSLLPRVGSDQMIEIVEMSRQRESLLLQTLHFLIFPNY
jgi:hypothetical protein